MHFIRQCFEETEKTRNSLYHKNADYQSLNINRMDIETAREYCLAKKAVTECLPFDEYSLVMKVMDKMFVLIDLEGSNKISMKCDPDYAIELREHYSAIEGAYHFNKKYWNQVFLDRDADDKLIKKLIDHAYEEVLKKFTKKMRTEYDALI